MAGSSLFAFSTRAHFFLHKSTIYVPMAFFTYQDHQLAYTEHGSGERPCVLIHGLLFSQRMHIPLAKALAERGNRVITLDLLGHGKSDRPGEMWRYSMSDFGAQIIALLDHLKLDEAVIAGMSLGANTTLEAAVLAPGRVRGLVVEMPVLDSALLGCALAFTPLMTALTFGEPGMKIVQRLAKAIPSDKVPFYGDVLLDWVRQDPRPSSAVMQGLMFGRLAPDRSLRRSLRNPALVIGHERDPVHPFSDADELARELPNARLVQAKSFLELRLAPERLTAEITDFLDTCWKPKPVKQTQTKRKPPQKTVSQTTKKATSVRSTTSRSSAAKRSTKRKTATTSGG